MLNEVSIVKDQVLSPQSLGCSIRSYGSLDTQEVRIIRFQVVIWYVGAPNEVLGKVDMRFRVTIFWNPPEEKDEEEGYGIV